MTTTPLTIEGPGATADGSGVVPMACGIVYAPSEEKAFERVLEVIETVEVEGYRGLRALRPKSSLPADEPWDRRLPDGRPRLGGERKGNLCGLGYTWMRPDDMSLTSL